MTRNLRKGWVLAGVLGLLLPALGQAALLHRDIGGVDLYYDDVLDITWLGNANLAATQTFGLTQSANVTPVAGEVGSTGRMNWATANAWIGGMNTAEYLGYSDWRLPGLSPINGTSFNTTFSNNATTDQGYADTGAGGGWRDGADNPVSEIGHMYYVNLGNLGRCTPNDGSPACTVQAGSGLSNTGSFTNLQSGHYWSGVEFGFSSAWRFYFDVGRQGTNLQSFSFFAWAVRPGDVGAQAVPEPGTLALFGMGLLGLLFLGRARRPLRLKWSTSSGHLVKADRLVRGGVHEQGNTTSVHGGVQSRGGVSGSESGLHDCGCGPGAGD